MKNISIIIGLIIVVALGFWLMGDSPSDQNAETTPTETPSNKVSPSVKASSSPKTTASAPSDTRSYTDLVKAYEGKRIQFDALCQAVPSYVTFKTGTTIMLDNRSGDARYVKIGQDEHYLGSYGYKIITLVSTSSAPTNVDISCGSAVNVGRILLQGNISNTQ